jgi:hypothetical protein
MILRLFVPLFCILLVVGCRNREYEIKKYNNGYSGEAVRSPFLAMSRLLAKYDIESNEGLRPKFDVSVEDTVVLSASSLRTLSQVDTIHDFIQNDGHIVLLLEFGERGFNDFRDSVNFSFFREQLDQKIVNALLKPYEMEVQTSDLPRQGKEGEEGEEFTAPVEDFKTEADLLYDKILREEDRRSYEIPFASEVVIEMEDVQYVARQGGQYFIKNLEIPSRRQQNSDNPTVANKDADKLHKIISKGHGSGSGRITVIADARMLRNPYMATQNHASIFLYTLKLSNSQNVLFSYGKSPSFYSLFAERFTFVLIGIGALVYFWLMAKGHRFGPILEAKIEQPLNYLKSIETRGFFYWEQKKYAYLISPLQARARKLIHLDTATMDQGLLFDALAAEFAVQRSEVDEAFGHSLINEASKFINAVSLLQKIIRKYE